MEITVIDTLIVLGFIMVLGFISNYIFNKTQIPSIVWLLLFGLFVGIIFNIQEINQQLLRQVSSLFGAVAIIIILFDGGINTNIYQLFRGAPRGLLLTVSGFCLSFIATFLVIIGLEYAGIIDFGGHGLVIGAVLGAIVGGTSSPIVIPLAYRLKNLQEKTKMVSSIESILTDPLCIVVVFAIYYMVFTVGELNLLLGIGNLVKTFSVGIVLGITFGLIWLFIMNRIRREQFSYIITLAVVFLVYSFTALIVGTSEGGEGAGAIACLMFGLVLGNGKKILKMVNYQGKGFEMDEETKQFHSLTSFVIRTFFFVYLGMIVSFQSINFILIGIIILLALLLVRYFAVYLSTYKGTFENDDKQTMTVMMPRGLAAAILAISFTPLILGIGRIGSDGAIVIPGYNLGAEMQGLFMDVAFVIILGTAIITTVGVSIISHNEMKKMKALESKKQEINETEIK
ncbi:MAG: cation:proton antiporter [Thermoplasmatales archaeon]|nr:cation:proton antiporter [Thermoplasmatales archaeon]MCK5636717.1 cation:proton antiporter [Thermoplasmatales archaeon]